MSQVKKPRNVLATCSSCAQPLNNFCDWAVKVHFPFARFVILQVNRSLRAPLSSQLIFMPGRAAVAAAAAAATVTQQPEAEAQVAPTSSLDGHSDSDQVCHIFGDLSA